MSDRPDSAVYYHDSRGVELVDQFYPRSAGQARREIDTFVEEHLNGRRPKRHLCRSPITARIESELRELQVRSGSTRYRILYQRSANLVVFLHALEKDT